MADPESSAMELDESLNPKPEVAEATKEETAAVEPAAEDSFLDEARSQYATDVGVEAAKNPSGEGHIKKSFHIPGLIPKDVSQKFRKKYASRAKHLVKLVDLLRAHSRRKIISNLAIMGVATPQLMSSKIKMVLDTMAYCFPEAFETLDKGSLVLFKEYVTSVLDVFHKSISGSHVMVIGPLMRFTIISICFGIDRALVALASNDHLFRDFAWNQNDTKYDSLYDVDDLPEIGDARFIYYACFNLEDPDPRTGAHQRIMDKVSDLVPARLQTIESQLETRDAAESMRKHREKKEEIEKRKIQAETAASPTMKNVGGERLQRVRQMALESAKKKAESANPDATIIEATKAVISEPNPEKGLESGAPKEPEKASKEEVVQKEPTEAQKKAAAAAEDIRIRKEIMEFSDRERAARLKAAEEAASRARALEEEEETERMRKQAAETKAKKDAAIRAQQKKYEDDLREAAKAELEARRKSDQMKKEWSEHLRRSDSPSYKRRSTFYPEEDDPEVYEKLKSRPRPTGLEYEGRPPSILKNPLEPESRPGSQVKFGQDKYKFMSDSEETDIEFQDTDYDDSDKEDHGSYKPRQCKPVHEEYVWATPGKDYDTEDEEDATRPQPPKHYSEGWEDPYVNTPLSRAGKVYKRESAYKEIPHTPTPIFGTALKDLQSAGYDPETAKTLLTASAAMASVMSTMTSDYKKQQKSVVEDIPPPKNLDLRINSFNYDVQGNTATQILGKRFNALRFPSEAVRKMIMKKIFEKVASHPLATDKARLIAINQLSQEDPLQAGRIEIQTLLDDSELTMNDQDIIPPPRIGKGSLDSSVLKTLQTRIGMGPTDRFTFEDMQSSKLKTLLSNLRNVIHASNLRESECYALMRRITDGISYENVWMAETEHKMSFADYWMSLQKTQRKVLSSKEYEKRLKTLLQQDRFDNLEKTLNEVLIYNTKIHQREIDASVRKLLCQRDSLRDIRAFIRKHYPSYASQVNTMFLEKLRQTAIQKNIPTYVNESLFHPGKSFLLMETALEVLSQAEPDYVVQKETREDKGHRKHSYIHAMTAESSDDHQELRSESRIEPDQNRGSTPGPAYSGGRGRSSYRGNRGRGGGRPLSRGPETQQPSECSQCWTSHSPKDCPFLTEKFRSQTPGGRTSRFGRKPDYRCHLCNVKGHSYRKCRTYPGQDPGDPPCNRCHGRHIGQCKSFIRGEGGRTRENSPSRVQIMALNGGAEEGQNQHQDQRQGQSQNYNRYPTPGPNDQPRHNNYAVAHQDQNRGYNQYPSQNYEGQDRYNRYPTPGPYQQDPNQGYGRGYDRYPTPGPGDQNHYRSQTPGYYQNYRQGRGYDRNRYYEDRRNQYRYQNDYRGSGRSGYRRGGGRGQSRYQSNGYQNGPREGQRGMDHRQLQQLEEMVKSLQNQKLHAHSSGQGGLGNDGHQPLTQAVVLNTLDATGQTLGGHRN